VFTRYEGVAIAAVLAFATEEKSFVAMRNITQYLRDLEKDPKLARLPTMIKKALKMLIDQKMFKAKKNFYAFTPRRKARAQGDVAHASTPSNPRTFP
jgi:hypothetical protein